VTSGRNAPARSGNDQPRGELIRQSALELFAERGYPATTMEEIGRTAGIRGPSIYRHYGSKQQLLVEIMAATMTELISEQQLAVRSTSDVVERLRRVVEAHVRYHARHRLEAFVGNREIQNLEGGNREAILRQRQTYERGLREVIETGIAEGRFHVGSARLASYAILDMGMGISAWFKSTGELSESSIVYAYGEFALKLVSAVDQDAAGRRSTAKKPTATR
jgi:AcrR family transcriptional regulator